MADWWWHANTSTLQHQYPRRLWQPFDAQVKMRVTRGETSMYQLPLGQLQFCFVTCCHMSIYRDTLVQWLPWVTDITWLPILSAYSCFDHSSERNFRRHTLFLPHDKYFFHWGWQSCWELAMAMACWPELLLLSLSMFLIEMFGYWPPTKWTLLASPTCISILLKIISANGENLSGILFSVWSIAIASMMTAVVWAGKHWRLSSPSSRSLGRAALSVFTNAPSNSVSDHGRGPSLWTSNCLKFFCLLWLITSNLAKRFLSVLRATSLPSFETVVFFWASWNVLSLNLGIGSKKPTESLSSLSSTNAVKASVPFFLAAS